MNGTIDNPYNLSEALNSGMVRPGDNIYLRGGTYSGDFVCNLNGSVNYPIIIKPYQNEKPIIDGSLIINGTNTQWEDIEVMYGGWTTRYTTDNGSEPPDLPFQKRITISGNNISFRRMILHDLAVIGCYHGSVGSSFNGCLVYNTGWNAPLRGHGHGLYLQNKDGRKLVKRCMIANSFGWNMHAYASSNGFLNNHDFYENTSFGSGAPSERQASFLLGGGIIATNPRFYRNMLYNESGQIGYSAGAINIERVGNYMPNGCSEQGTISYDIDEENILIKPESGKTIFCYIDEYRDTRGYLTVYNWDLSDSVIADLTAITGLSIGDTARLRCAENYDNCYQDLVLDAEKKVTVDMRAVSHSVVTPIGHDYTPLTTFPEFGAFIVEKLV